MHEKYTCAVNMVVLLWQLKAYIHFNSSVVLASKTKQNLYGTYI